MNSRQKELVDFLKNTIDYLKSNLESAEKIVNEIELVQKEEDGKKLVKCQHFLSVHSYDKDYVTLQCMKCMDCISTKLEGF